LLRAKSGLAPEHWTKGIALMRNHSTTQNEKRSALVVGGAQYLGRYVVEKLLAQGQIVHIYDDREAPRPINSRAIWHKGDIRDYETLAPACRGVDTVYHVAELSGFHGKREDFFNFNSRGTANVIRACVENKVSRLIYSSTPAVLYGKAQRHFCNIDESTPYPRRYDSPCPASKAVAEKMVLAADNWEMVIRKKADEIPAGSLIDTEIRRLSTCAIRPHFVYGPGEPLVVPWLLQQARKNRLRQVGNGDNLAHLTHVGNAADALITAADRLTPDSSIAGHVIHIADGDPVNLWEWINEILKECGLAAVTKKRSCKTARRIGALEEWFRKIFPVHSEPGMTRFLASMLGGSHYSDLHYARSELGYAPAVNLTTGTDELVKWIKAELLK
ncbi:MAG: NAD-dependent epimerase/dehydratase family protein, partial [Lentisphaeria bacterium]